MTIGPCPPNTPPPHGVVVFNFTEWAAAYPEFAGIAPAKAQAAFDSATLLMSNSCRSLIRDAAKRQRLLYLLTAHVCFLRFGSNDGSGTIVPAPGVVGRVASATEGTVTAAIEYASNIPLTAAYFQQTQWGALWWASTAQYRTFRYAPPPVQCCTGCGAPVGLCGCGTLGPVGTGWPGYNGGSA